MRYERGYKVGYGRPKRPAPANDRDGDVPEDYIINTSGGFGS